MSNKYVKVMFDTTSGASDFEYKINEINISNNWNPSAKNGRDFGGFKYSTEDWKGTTELYLRREKSYLLRCMDFVISRGEYEVRDNILILKDEDLNCEYELLIAEDCLMSKRTPKE